MMGDQEARDKVTASMKGDLFHMMCQDYIGSGMGRVVWVNSADVMTVIKFEHQGFQNVMEWHAWLAVKDTDHAKWFAPCLNISPCGMVLIQRRTTPAANCPEMIPAYLTDTKLSNYGILMGTEEKLPNAGAFVCHDYGTNMLLENGLTKRMQKANWWNL